MANLVQTAKNTTILPLPASIFGASGTRGALHCSITFTDPITAGNDILLSVMGNVGNAACEVLLGGILGFFDGLGTGGSLPDRTYWVGLTYTDSAGQETELGPVGSVFIPMGKLLRVFRPNIENPSGAPGMSAFSIYVSLSGPTGLGLVAGGLDPINPSGPATDHWTEPSGGVSPGGGPPTTPVRDSLGNSYVQCNWVDQFEGGSNSGNNAMGFFLASGSPGGANTVNFACACFNANPGFPFDGILSVIACEFTPLGSTQDSDYLKLHAASGNIDIALIDSDANTIDTDWGSRNGNTAMVLDLSPAPGTDSFFAMFCNAASPDPPTPTLTGGVYTFIDSQAPDSIPHWLWFSSPTEITLACPLDGGTATVGVPYSAFLVVTGDVPPDTFEIISGALPDGLTLDTSTGEISGTPMLAGTFDYVAEVTDSSSPPASADTSPGCEIVVSGDLTVACPVAGGTATTSVPYNSGAPPVSGGTPPYFFTLASGTLPTGFTLDPFTGIISGTTEQEGIFEYTLEVQDSGSPVQFAEVPDPCTIVVSVNQGCRFRLLKLMPTFGPAKKLPVRGSVE